MSSARAPSHCPRGHKVPPGFLFCQMCGEHTALVTATAGRGNATEQGSAVGAASVRTADSESQAGAVPDGVSSIAANDSSAREDAAPDVIAPESQPERNPGDDGINNSGETNPNGMKQTKPPIRPERLPVSLLAMAGLILALFAGARFVIPILERLAEPKPVPEERRSPVLEKPALTPGTAPSAATSVPPASGSCKDDPFPLRCQENLDKLSGGMQ